MAYIKADKPLDTAKAFKTTQAWQPEINKSENQCIPESYTRATLPPLHALLGRGAVLVLSRKTQQAESRVLRRHNAGQRKDVNSLFCVAMLNCKHSCTLYTARKYCALNARCRTLYRLWLDTLTAADVIRTVHHDISLDIFSETRGGRWGVRGQRTPQTTKVSASTSIRITEPTDAVGGVKGGGDGMKRRCGWGRVRRVPKSAKGKNGL